MHLDFHYYLTLMACLEIGFDYYRCLQIAEFAQIVDETYNGGPKKKRVAGDNDQSYYWTIDSWVRNGHVQRTVTKVASKQMVQKGKARGKWFNLSWTGFHFLPNLDDQPSNNPYRNTYRWAHQDLTSFDLRYLKGIVRKLDLDYEQKLICYPGSKLVTSMLQDTESALKAKPPHGQVTYQPGGLRHWIGSGVERRVLEDFENNVSRGAVSGQGFLDALVGLRLHVFADTWAHQGFAGPRSPRINDASMLKVGEGREQEVNVIDHKSAVDAGLGGKSVTPASHYGHGNVLRYPDYPAYHYSYRRPFDRKSITRNNPDEYSKAYGEVFNLLKKYDDSNPQYKAYMWTRNQFNPEKINSSFFRDHLSATSKYQRYKKLYGMIEKYLRNDHRKEIMYHLVKPADAEKDFGVIDHLRRDDSGKRKLAYFSLAARCHLAWIEKELNKVFKPDFNRYVQQNQTYKV